MRWLAYLGLLLIILTPAYAALTDGSTLFTEYKKNLGKGACQVTYGTDYNYAPGDKKEGAMATGYFPSTNNCNTLIKNYPYQSDGAALTIYSAASYDANKEAIILSAADWHWYEDKWSGGFHHNWEGFGLGVIDKTKINPAVSTTDPIPVFNLAFGGGTLQTTYGGTSGTTYTPQTISYTDYASDKEHLPDSFVNTYGRLPPRRSMWGDQEERWYSSLYSIVPPSGTLNTAYTLPLPQYCTNFQLEARDTGGGQVGTTRVDMEQTSTGYSKSLANGQDNTIVDLEVKNGILNKISIKVNGPNYNQIALTIYCIPGDADENKLACEANPNWKWNEAANTDTEKNGCCGDDGPSDETGVDYGGLRCTKGTTATTQNKYTWSNAALACTYPAGWKLGTTADLKKDAEASYLTGAGCCSDPNNFGKTKRLSTTNEAVCILTNNNEARWKQSNNELFVAAVNPTSNSFLAAIPINLSSNGTNWLACGNSTQTTTIKVPATQTRTAGACQATQACDQNQLDACMYPALGAQTNNCQDQLYVSDNGFGSTQQCCEAELGCSATAQTNSCEQYTNTACNTDNQCECPSGQTWSGSACIPFTQCANGLTYNSTSKQCEGLANALYTQATICTQNTKDSSGYICTTQWEVFDKGYQYLFDNNKKYITNQSDQTWMNNASYFCQDGQQLSGTLKYTPKKDARGICKTDQCYLGTATKACVGMEQFVYSDYCTNLTKPNTGEWTTRTQFLAEALYNKAGADDFVLHCDEYTESINDKNTAIQQYEKKYINTLCVLSKDDAAQAIGVSLNGNSTGGRAIVGDSIDYQPDLQVPAFADILNSTAIKDGETIVFGADKCTEATTTNDPYAFTRCDTMKGSVLYNANKSLLVFSAQDGYTLEQTFFEKFTNWFKSTFTTAKQTPPYLALAGKKIYAAQKSDKRVQAVLQAEYPNKQQAIIVYENINVTSMCKRYEAKKRATCTPLTDSLYKVNITNPTQSEWEAFTLLVRP